jgi:putative heme iron utilization protein
MRILGALAVLAVLAASPSVLRADLKIAMAETDLGKRSKLALDNAEAALKATREAYNNV